ncbi:histone deacetylase [Flavobacteriaceae bacterium]|nr:histone deacetylase [Flavobacteriaceae bacterium]
MLKIAFDKIYKHPLEKNHRFPMDKYDLIPQRLIEEGTCNKNNFFIPGELSNHDVLSTHQKYYFERLISLSLTKKEIRPIGFPMSEELIVREKKISQGTIECSNFAIKNGISMNIAGGTHHAFYDRAEAFCMLNDQAIAANYLLNNKLASKILIIDLDVHQGNGTASIFKDNPSVFTLSFHGEKNYPFRKEKSDLDFGFEDHTDDDFYLAKLKDTIPKVIDDFMPDFIFYLAGVDILKNDKLGRLSMTIKGCNQRDSYILNACKTNNIPLQVSMGGGYSTDIEEIVEAHANTFRLAQEIYF